MYGQGQGRQKGEVKKKEGGMKEVERRKKAKKRRGKGHLRKPQVEG